MNNRLRIPGLMVTRDPETMEEETYRQFYPALEAQDLVLKFHRAFGAPVADEPQAIGSVRGQLRAKMLKEELFEFKVAVEANDIVEQYDALLDILVLAFGGLVEMGLDAGPGFREVMRANMSKLDAEGKPIVSRGIEQDGFPEGKILKGPNYKKPDLFGVLVDMGWVPTFNEYLDHHPEAKAEHDLELAKSMEEDGSLNPDAEFPVITLHNGTKIPGAPLRPMVKPKEVNPKNQEKK